MCLHDLLWFFVSSLMPSGGEEEEQEEEEEDKDKEKKKKEAPKKDHEVQRGVSNNIMTIFLQNRPQNLQEKTLALIYYRGSYMIQGGRKTGNVFKTYMYFSIPLNFRRIHFCTNFC